MQFNEYLKFQGTLYYSIFKNRRVKLVLQPGINVSRRDR